MTVTTESGGRQNAFPNETRPYIDESVSYEGYPQNAEKVNGRWAMVGFAPCLKRRRTVMAAPGGKGV